MKMKINALLLGWHSLGVLGKVLCSSQKPLASHYSFPSLYTNVAQMAFCLNCVYCVYCQAQSMSVQKHITIYVLLLSVLKAGLK